MSLISVIGLFLSGVIGIGVLFFFGFIFPSPFPYPLGFATKRLIPYMQHAHIVF
jgi:hypothetical protein